MEVLNDYEKSNVIDFMLDVPVAHRVQRRTEQLKRNI